MGKTPKKYLGICDWIGPYPRGSIQAWLIGVGGTTGINMIFNAMAGRVDLSHNWLIAAVGAAAGCYIATEVHDKLNQVFSNKQIGLSRGSALVKKAQLAAFAIPVSAALSFNVLSDYRLAKPSFGFSDYLPSHEEPHELAQQPNQFHL